MQLTNLCLRLSWVTLVKCSPWVSLNSLPSFLPPSTPTLQARPSLNIKIVHCRSLFRKMYVYLYSNLIWSIAQPRLAVIFVTQYLFCVSSCPSSISWFVTSSIATLTLLIQAHKVSIPADWMCYLSISWYQQLWEHCSQTCEQYTWGQSHSPSPKKQGERKIPRRHIWSFCSTFELSNLEEEAKVEYWGKGRQKSAEAVPAVCTVCTQKYA